MPLRTLLYGLMRRQQNADIDGEQTMEEITCILALASSLLHSFTVDLGPRIWQKQSCPRRPTLHLYSNLARRCYYSVLKISNMWSKVMKQVARSCRTGFQGRFRLAWKRTLFTLGRYLPPMDDSAFRKPLFLCP